MTIHRSNPTSASSMMTGDFVRIVNPRGASYPAAAALGPAVVLIATGMFGKVSTENGQNFLVPDERVPLLLRQLGKMQLSEAVMVERVSVEHEHEKAILGLQYLRSIADVARQRASDASGNVDRGVMQALLGDAATADLKRIADELSAAGMQVVEKVTVEKIETRTIILTRDPEAVRNGEIPSDSMSFAAEPAEAVNTEFSIHDASRTSELLLAPRAMREVQEMGRPVAPAVEVATPQANLMQMLGLGHLDLSQDDVVLGDPGDDDDQGGPAPGV